MLFLFVLVVFLASFLLAAAAAMAASHFLEKGGERGATQKRGASSDSPTLLKMDELSSISIWDSLLHRFDFVEGMQTRITEADINWTVGRLTALMLLIGAFAFAILTSLNWTPFWMEFLLACGAAALPYMYVLRRRSKRLEEFQKQFPDALDFLSRSLRAGHPLPVAIELLAQEDTPPLSTEMRKTVEERKLGMQFDQALENLATRVPIVNVRVFVAAVKLQSRTGGKLSEILDGLGESMREAGSVEGEVKALAAHGRVTGAVLTALPVLIALMMSFVNPGYLNIIVENPTARIVTIVCILALVAAHFVIKKIVDVKV